MAATGVVVRSDDGRTHWTAHIGSVLLALAATMAPMSAAVQQSTRFAPGSGICRARVHTARTHLQLCKRDDDDDEPANRGGSEYC